MAPKVSQVIMEIYLIAKIHLNLFVACRSSTMASSRGEVSADTSWCCHSASESFRGMLQNFKSENVMGYVICSEYQKNRICRY